MASIGQELLDVPIDDMIRSMAEGIADAQYRLDRTSIQIAQMMSGVNEEDRVFFGKRKYSLLELGFTPTFYQFVDTLIEVKISISMKSTSEYSTTAGRSVKISAYSASVNASYANKYSYSVEGSSLLRTKLVPVPPPSILEERIRALIEEEAKIQNSAGGNIT
ncbi:MAG: hypothetical protein HUU38_17575 [Anaerolineales bacterium]|jgi:hypothetical protein|nr:hypothetical protein [Anaerolineales bacterium]